MSKYWDSYFDLNMSVDKVSYGQLALDCYYPKNGLSFIEFFLKQSKLCEHAFGELCEVVTVSKQISVRSQAVYNRSAWDESTLGSLDEDTVMDGHEAVIECAVDRIRRFKVSKIGLGYMARWKNPYIKTGEQFRWGVNITFQYRKGHMMVRVNLSKPSMWFSTNFRPLFPSDKMVRENPNLPYNKNDRGVIVPRESYVHDNRIKLLWTMSEISKAASSPVVMLLAYANVKFSPAARKVVAPRAQMDKDDAHAQLVAHKMAPDIELVDSRDNPLPGSAFSRRFINGAPFMLEESHFGFITEDVRRL